MQQIPAAAIETTTRPRTRFEIRLYLLVLAVTVLVRVAAIIGTDPQKVIVRWSGSVGSLPSRARGMIWDPELYDVFGWNLATEGVMGVGSRPSAFCMPAYPILLAGTYKIAGHLPGAVRWVQVLLSSLAVLFLGAVARRLGGPRAEIVAVFIGGMYPFYVYFVREMLTETLFVCAFSAALLMASRAGARGSILDGLLHGVATSVAVMTRPVGFFLAPGILILARPWASEGRKRRLRGLFLGALIFAGVWGSWILRNRQAFGEPVLMDTHGGWMLYFGQLTARGVDFGEAMAKLGYQHTDILRGTLPGGSRGELEGDRKSGEKAMKIIRGDPAGFLVAVIRNSQSFWLGSNFGEVADNRGMRDLMTLVGLASYPPVLLLGLLGLVRCWRTGRRDFFWAAVILMVTTTLLHSTVGGGKRYRASTVDPVLIVLAAWQASHLLTRWWREPQSSAETAAAG